MTIDESTVTGIVTSAGAVIAITVGIAIIKITIIGTAIIAITVMTVIVTVISAQPSESIDNLDSTF